MANKISNKKLEELNRDFREIRGYNFSNTKTKSLLKKVAKKKYLHKYLNILSKEGKEISYPSQGIVKTEYDYLDYDGMDRLNESDVTETLAVRQYFLGMYNHPLRIHYLDKTNKTKFTSPPKIVSNAINSALTDGLSLSIGDIGANVVGTDHERGSRTEAYAKGPFVKLGKQARNIFVGSSSPDVWNSSMAIATMSASHSLSGIPRNGLLYDLDRQADLAKEVFEILDYMRDDLLSGRDDAESVHNYWKNNVMGTLEASVEKALIRAEKLYDSGIRTFRVYSPEPGTGPIDTTKALRKKYGSDIEIFTSLMVDVDQAKAAEKAGADGIFVGIGGGGRCITGVRSGSTVNWPELVFSLRGEIGIPIIAEGGASDSIAETLLLGASGVSVSRVASGGTIESPGGILYCRDKENGKRFKPYGGEASARTKSLDGKLMPFGIPAFVEGETTKAIYARDYDPHLWGTITHNLHILNENAILAMVFRNVRSIEELHALNPSPLRRITPHGDFQRKTH